MMTRSSSEHKLPTRKRQRDQKVARRVRTVPLALKQHSFVFHQTLGQITSSDIATVKGAIAFKLSDVTDNAHIVGLFDQFKIRKVVVEFVPRRTTAIMVTPDTATDLATSIPMFATTIDYDTDTAPTAITDIREFSQNKETTADRYQKWVFTPAILNEVYRSAITTSYSTVKNQWLDTNHTDVPHRGIRYFMEAGGVKNGLYQYDIKTKYYIDCKCIR